MESYGAILKKAREEKMLDFATIERDTFISKKYLEALEAEETSEFPGEAHLVGFLKNYASYLGVDVDEVLKYYHAKKIQEAPIPDGLIEKQKPAYVLPLIIIFSVLGVLLLVALIVFLLVGLPKIKSEHQQIIEQSTKAKQYTLSESGLTKRLYKGDQIFVPTGEGEGNIILTVNKTIGNLSLETPGGNQFLDLSEERELDINGDGNADIIVYLSDISASDETRGAEVRLLPKNGAEISSQVAGAQETSVETVVEAVSKNVKQTLILEDNRAYPFTVNVSFRGACIFRHRVDNKEVIEDYYTNGDNFPITANNGIRLWMSNINAIKIQVIANSKTFDLEVGKAGQVKVEDIKWVKDGEGKYRLVVMELD